jgi:hypothetical protein
MARRRGRVPPLSRLTWWAGLGVVSVLGGAPEAALPGLAVFETLLAPRLTRRPRRPLGPSGRVATARVVAAQSRGPGTHQGGP